MSKAKEYGDVSHTLRKPDMKFQLYPSPTKQESNRLRLGTDWL